MSIVANMHRSFTLAVVMVLIVVVSVCMSTASAFGSPAGVAGQMSASTGDADGRVAGAASDPSPPVAPTIDDNNFGAAATISQQPARPRAPLKRSGGAAHPAVVTGRPAAGQRDSNASSQPCSEGSLDDRCRVAQAACSGATAAIVTDSNGAFVGYVCGGGPPVGGGEPAPAAAPAPPPVPTFGQIQQAFRELPFCKPSPSMQPVGGKTVVNLATYYEAGWPDGACLSPGETSAKVQLLSWSVEFTVAARDYRFSYGDGASSGWTTSTGGGYPDGDITHAYRDTGSVNVRVDARLTGSYRVDGGSWQDIETVADLQDEPAATYEVVEAKNRLQADPTG